jgi:hypothetical protein
MMEWPFAAAFPVVAFVGAFLVAQMRDALAGPAGGSWGKAALVGALASLLIPGVTFALCLTYSGDWRASLIDMLPVLPGALVLTPAALILPALALALDSVTYFWPVPDTILSAGVWSLALVPESAQTITSRIVSLVTNTYSAFRSAFRVISFSISA